MQPDRRGGGLESRHALRQKPQSDAGENVARAGGRQLRRRSFVDHGAAIRRGDHGVVALEQHYSAARPRRAQGTLDLAAGRVKQPGELPFMRG